MRASLKHRQDEASRSPSDTSAGVPGKRTLSGQLPSRVAARAGAVLGHDFSSVSVHEDGQADALGTRAFARGDELHFAAGAYQTAQASGLSLIGHELSHIAQQREGRVAATGAIGGVAVNTDARLEAEADAGGAKIAQGFDLDAILDFSAPTRSGASAAGPAIAQGSDLDASAATPSATTDGQGPATASAAGPATHVVVAGETLQSIAKASGVSVEELKVANAAQLKRWTTPTGKVIEGFDAGATITIPASASAAPAPAAPAPEQGGGDVEGGGAEPAPASGSVVNDVVDAVAGAVSGAIDTASDLLFGAIDFVFGPGGEEVPAEDIAVDPAPIGEVPAPAAEPEAGQASSPFFSQRDNEVGKDGAETIGNSDRVAPDSECNVTTLAMQLVALAGDATKVNEETLTMLTAAGGSGALTEQPEDLILKLFIAWGDAYWEKVCNDPANKALFPKMARDVTFYQHYSDPLKTSYGWHQIGQCLNWVGQLYSFVGGSGFHEQKEGSFDPTDAAYYQSLRPALDGGAAVMLSTKLTGGHIVLLVGIDDEGIWINDPYGVKIGGPKSKSSGYVRNNESSPVSKAALFVEYAANLDTRFKKNPDLAAIAKDEEARKQPVPNWGEGNYFTFAEVKTYELGKWNSVLEKA
ncbi:MAG: DUF4157 domain-containing protein [Kofleriaceae bacterium]